VHIELEVGDVVVRLPTDVPAFRIADIARVGVELLEWVGVN
jgi:hypothetical protein